MRLPGRRWPRAVRHPARRRGRRRRDGRPGGFRGYSHRGARGRRYLLRALRGAFETSVAERHVVSAWAGLRSLISGRGDRTADLSRRHVITVSPLGMVTVTGGKLTTFRAMARQAVDAVGRRLGVSVASTTRRIPLGLRDPGAAERILTLAGRIGLDAAQGSHLLVAHGDRAPAVLELITEDPWLGEPLVSGLDPLRAEAVWAARSEMALTLADVLDRGLRLALYDARGIPADLARSVGTGS